MNSLPQAITADEFNPTPEDAAWVARAFNHRGAELAPRTAPAAPVNGQPVTLAEFVDHEAMSYRSQGTREAAFVAEYLERLGQLIRWTGATTPAEHIGRMDVWDADIRQQWFDRGYHDGREAARRELAPFRPE